MRLSSQVDPHHLNAASQDSYLPKLEIYIYMLVIPIWSDTTKFIHVRTGSRTILSFVVYQLEYMQSKSKNHVNHFSLIFLLFPILAICSTDVVFLLFIGTLLGLKICRSLICDTKKLLHSANDRSHSRGSILITLENWFFSQWTRTEITRHLLVDDSILNAHAPIHSRRMLAMKCFKINFVLKRLTHLYI